MSFEVATSERLHARVRALIEAFERGASPGAPAPESFDAVGIEIARHQAALVPGYARLCARHGVDIANATSLSSFPAVPTEAFKHARVAVHPATSDTAVFRTSGTTVGQRGEHALRITSTYEAAATAFGRFALARDLPARVPVLVLGPPPSELPDSSLTHMFETFRRELAVPASEEQTYFVREGIFMLDAMDERISRLLAEGTDHALLLGTSFAFAELLAALDSESFRLPSQTRIMQTGGFKGRVKEIPEATLRRELARTFGVDSSSIMNEYGMTELGSQFYTQEPFGNARYVSPPWARVRAVDPVTLTPVPPGTEGIARIEDLVNVDSACVILTQDRVRETAEGFELLGRTPGATPRGCSLTLEEMLGP